MDELLRLSRPILPLVALVAVPVAMLWLVFLVQRRRTGVRGRRVLRTATADALLLISISAIILVTLRPLDHVDWGVPAFTLMPFEDLIRSVGPGMPDYAVRLALTNLAGNILLFVPLGIALGLRFPTTSLWRLVVVCAGLSIGIELVQLVPRIARASDITDILTNTTGGLLGAVGARFLVVAARRNGSGTERGDVTRPRSG